MSSLVLLFISSLQYDYSGFFSISWKDTRRRPYPCPLSMPSICPLSAISVNTLDWPWPSLRYPLWYNATRLAPTLRLPKVMPGTHQGQEASQSGRPATRDRIRVELFMLLLLLLLLLLLIVLLAGRTWPVLAYLVGVTWPVFPCIAL